MAKVAVVTGALKGIGLETSKELLKKGFRVVLAGRDEKRGKAVEKELKDLGDASFMLLNAADPKSIERFGQAVIKKYTTIDVLINNAGVYPDIEIAENLTEQAELMHLGFATNAVGPFLLIETFLPLMIKKGSGRIVNVSSGMSQLSDMGQGAPAYRISKAALNALTVYFANTTRGTDVLINAVCPGWVKTDMGGPKAPRTVEQGAEGVVWGALLPIDGPNGGLFRDGKILQF